MCIILKGMWDLVQISLSEQLISFSLCVNEDIPVNWFRNILILEGKENLTESLKIISLLNL